MKDYKSVAEDVFRRSGEIIEQNNRRKRTLTKIGASAGCLVAAGAVGFGVWKGSGLQVPKTVISEGQFANDGKDHSGEIDVVFVDPAKGGDNPVPGGVTEPSGNSGSVGEETSQPAAYPPTGESTDGANTDISVVLNGIEIPIVDYFETDEDYAYNVPENGQIILSYPLKAAMMKYNNPESGFRTIVEFYKDGKLVEPANELYESERDKFGIGLKYETIMPGLGKEAEHYISFSGTADQLNDLTLGDEYGYVISLRGNYFGYTDDTLDEKREIYCGLHDTIIDIEDDELSRAEYSPQNGDVIISEDLKKAFKTYGEGYVGVEPCYNVVIEYYKDGKHINTTKELWKSENERASDIHLLNSIDSAWGNYHIQMCEFREPLENFTASDEYGCVIYLHNVYFRRCGILD